MTGRKPLKRLHRTKRRTLTTQLKQGVNEKQFFFTTKNLLVTFLSAC